MPVSSVRLQCFGGSEPEELVTATIDIGQPQSFFAWTTVSFMDGWQGGPWDFDNSIIAEVYLVDGSPAPIDAFGGPRLGNFGDDSNLHQTAFSGFGQFITFRLRDYNPTEIEIQANGIVLFGI